MGFDVSRAVSQARKLNHYTDSLQDIKKSMETYKENINIQWQAQELTHINNAIDRLSKELYMLSQKLVAVSDDIVQTAYEIRNEEIAREKYEAAEKSKSKD